MITLYGIKNCDTVKKAKLWLADNAIEYHFHDFRTDGLSADSVNHWIAELGWETLLNKRSTTWKQLDSVVKENMNEKTAQIAILAQPTLIKRPLLDTEDARHVGFKPDIYANIFSRKRP
ncbi:MAG: Spx/MgsR family transcriptional regulator [Halioglobus sp.]